MHPLWRLGWRAAGLLAEAASALAPADGGKLARSLAARRGARERLTAWAATARDPSRPLLWMHAPSVGEGLMARPILDAVRTHHPSAQIAYTWFSPSAERFAARLVPGLADVVGPLPFDTPAAAQALLEALRPNVVALAKTDVWPMLVETAARRGIPVVLTSAANPGRGRRSRTARALLGDAYRSLAAVGAVDADAADALAVLGVVRERITITGDTRYDQAVARADAAAADGRWARQLGTRPTLVAGSTWPSDERVLLEAWALVVAQIPDARLIIAPHEPDAAHLDPLEAACRRHRLAPVRLDAAGPGDSCVIVDRVGVLADLYTVASVAYVGGGFHDAGLHSVVEPAACGVPVLCGPAQPAQRDAAALAARGALRRLHDAAALQRALVEWWSPNDTRATAAAAARDVAEQGRGATARSLALLSTYLRR